MGIPLEYESICKPHIGIPDYITSNW